MVLIWGLYSSYKWIHIRIESLFLHNWTKHNCTKYWLYSGYETQNDGIGRGIFFHCIVVCLLLILSVLLLYNAGFQRNRNGWFKSGHFLVSILKGRRADTKQRQPLKNLSLSLSELDSTSQWLHFKDSGGSGNRRSRHTILSVWISRFLSAGSINDRGQQWKTKVFLVLS